MKINCTPVTREERLGMMIRIESINSYCNIVHRFMYRGYRTYGKEDEVHFIKSSAGL
jgi:hypothetical protein